MKRVENEKGPGKALVTIVEYFDYQSPECADAEKPIRQVMDAFENDVRLVVRHFPFTERHEWAGAAALAAEAAARQGKFWEMHDLLFQNQDSLNPDTIMALAEELELDMERFRADFDSPECEAMVNDDIESGNELGVEETPAVWVNGVLLEEAVTFEALSRAVVGYLSVEAA